MAEPLTFMAVHAHPDDESITMGGTFARYAADGTRSVLVCCTRGEEGEIHDPTLDPVRTQPRLGAIREEELRAAAAILNVGALYLLPYRDSGMQGSAANENPDNFINADPAEAGERVAAIIRATRPHVVITYDAGGGYGHPDHKMAHRVTHEAIARAAYDGAGGSGWQAPKLYYTAVSLTALLEVNRRMRERGLTPPFAEDDHAFDIRQLAAPDEAITARVFVRPYHEQVRQALRAYRTQLPEDDVLLTLPPDLAAEAFAVDCYIRAYTRVRAPMREDDLFAGLC